MEQAEEIANNLQFGNRWDRKIVNQVAVQNYPKDYIEYFRSVAKIQVLGGNATAFYLGKHAEEYIFATNNHVLPYSSLCRFATKLTFFDGQETLCKRFLGTSRKFELTLFSVVKSDKVNRFLDSLKPFRFDFINPPQHQEKLITIGYGGHNNGMGELSFVDDELCMVASQTSDFRLVDGEMILSKGKATPAQTLSFMHSCEGSRGDSGSPLISKKTGLVIGVYWGGKTPKGPRMRDPEYIRRVINENRDKVIWSKFNMATPSIEIGKELRTIMGRKIPDIDRQIIQSILSF
jgi:hypothetical protein